MARPKSLQETLPGFWRILRHFWPHLRDERGLLAGSLAALFAEVGLRLLEPWPLKVVFDRVINTGAPPPSTGIPFLDTLDPMTLLILAAVGVVAVTALRALAAYFNTVGFAMVGNKVITRVRSQVYYHLQRLSLNFHTKARSGDLVVRVIGDVSQLKDVAVTALLPMMANVLILFGMVALMLWLNWQLTLLALATVPLFWLTTVRLTGRIQDAARKQRKREGAMAATAAESIGAIKIVQALSLEDTLAAAFFDQNKQSLKQDARASKLSASLERAVDILIAVSTGLVLWYGALLVINKTLTPGDLLVFLTYLKNGFKPVRDFAKYTGRLAKATAAGERVLDLLEREPDVRDLPGAVPAPAFRGAVRFDGVAFEYEAGHSVLQEINLNVAPGQHVALVGPSGNGKSTLVSLILRLYDPTGGRVEIDGRDIRDYTLESLRSQISVVMQDTVLFAASVRDNIAYGAPDATQEEIEAAARLANAHEFIEAMPEGYDTVLGERGATLSNGQRQRISIARAAIRRAPIVILDEPTTGLDEANERLVMQAIRRLIEGRTAFLITHRLMYAHDADLVLVMEHGRIVERGSHIELLQAGGAYVHLHYSHSTHGAARSIPAAREHTSPNIVLPWEEGAREKEAATASTGSARLPLPGEGAEALPYDVYRSHSLFQRLGSRRTALAGGLITLLVGPVLLAAALNANLGFAGGRVADIASAGLPAQSARPGVPAGPTPADAHTEIAQAEIGRAALHGRGVVTFSGFVTGPLALDWSPDGGTLAIGSGDNAVRLLDTESGQVVSVSGHRGPVYMVGWSPDGETLASGGADGTIRLWGRDGRAKATLTGHSTSLSGIAWTADGQKLLSASTELKVQMWSKDGAPIGSVVGGGNFVSGLVWSPDGSTLTTASSDGTVKLWRNDGTLLFTLDGHTDQVYCLAWSPDGKVLASGSNDNTVRLWSSSGEALGTLQGHTSFVNSVAWSPDGMTLASGAADKAIRLWSRDGAALATLPDHNGLVMSLDWSPDGKTLAAGISDNSIRLWR